MLKEDQNLSKDIFNVHIESKPTREGYGDGVLEAGEINEDVVVLCGDLTESTKSDRFAHKFPNRFFDVGVAEQNMAGIAAGLALSGKVPFIASYATFNPGRNLDQIRVSICFSKANVKIIGAHGGLSTPADGATHQALEDLAIMRTLPNMIVLYPCDYLEAKKATLKAANHKGPVYIRLARDKTPIFTTKTTPFEIGAAQVLMEGRDITVIATGPLVYEGLKAAQELKIRHGISVEVINLPTIKPLDKKTILKSVQKTRRLITVEEHQMAGGMGSTIAEFLAQEFPLKMKIMGMPDLFGESGLYDELLEKYGLNAHHIELEVIQFMQGK
ncbi:transketolase family protein [candidate division WWE3 bacterium]|nr:transketolase family protein [candidate division WWE3 bacterium]